MTKGIDEILANLDKLQVKNRRAARLAVSDGAEEFKSILESNTPEDDEDGIHLVDNINISGFKGANVGLISKDIGFGQETGWRSHFPDDGTMYQRKQNFKEKSINQATPKVKEIYAERIREGLGL